MKLRMIIEKIQEELLVEKAMADKYLECMQYTEDEGLKETFRQIRIDEEKHAIITGEILDILEKYVK
jgi:rubrerythrin